MLDRRDNNAGAGAPAPQQAAPAPTAPMQQQTQAAIDPITLLKTLREACVGC
jgi:hypothetical protein